MRTTRLVALLAVMAFAPACRHQPVRPDAPDTPALTAGAVEQTLAFAAQQAWKTEQRLPPNAHPKFTAADFAGGTWATAERTDWRSGFFPGVEWLMFEAFGNGGGH